MDDRSNTIAGWVLAGGIAALGLHWQLGGVAVAALSIGASRVRLPLSRAAELAGLMRLHWPTLKGSV